MLNALTIDVEDYFQVNAFASSIDYSAWDSYPLRVAENTRRILDLLDRFEVKATFFILGWIAERLPGLIREIHDRGHEIACHGYRHQLVYTLSPDAFRADLRLAKQLLEDICGEDIVSYRAPSYSITKKSLWALDILAEEGFCYDSSIFPVYHDTYGIPDAPRFLHHIERKAGRITEFPLTTIRCHFGPIDFRLPVAGGGYLRLFPAQLLRAAIGQVNTVENQPAIFYFHPWEIDPDQPRIKAGLKSTFRHYLNLHRTENKICHLLSRLRFGTMREVISRARTESAADGRSLSIADGTPAYV